MKNNILILCLAILPLFSLAQKDELLLGLSMGVNYPLGDFASTEYAITGLEAPDTQGQFAKTGLAFDFSASYRLGYYLGFAGRIMGGTNKTHNSKYTDAINEVLDDEGLQSTVSSKGWGNGGVLVGAYFVLPIHNLYIDARVMGGYLNLFSPEIRYYIYETDVNDSELFVREKYSAGGFAYDIGLGLKYKFGSNKFLLLNGDYVAAKIVKDHIQTLNPFTQKQEYVNMDIDYQNLTLTLGIGYIF